MLLFVSYIYIYIIVASKRDKERIAPGLSTQIQLSVILKKKSEYGIPTVKKKKIFFIKELSLKFPVFYTNI